MRRVLAATVSLWLLLVPTLALAHPHAWIDLRTRVVADGDGRVAGLRQHWEIDPLYSLMLMEEFGSTGEGGARAEGLERLAETMLGNMAEFDYMTRLTIDGERVAWDGVEDVRLTVDDASDALHFRFTLMLSEPVALGGRQLEYAVYDPTYYIEILHDDGDAIETGALGPGCSVHVREPDPPQSLVARLARIDRSDNPVQDGVGARFAERVRIGCSA
ncbi:DUF1007 family protein [Aquisalimonas lutea]|uniref:DUF1007 family protein n=1 Tax=Aquisalimonas lutea TaxID=1327750 RepID=UPI0025B42EA5|nr:DUF1007 family protein [Aquisalimonas lutea]MDN3519155.1 DUF1007 family protein [Aquisalimonas lutea]